MSDQTIPDEELKIEAWPLRPKGGQHVGDTSRAVKVTHLPTGTEALCSMARSQHHNRRIALEMIEFALTHPNS